MQVFQLFCKKISNKKVKKGKKKHERPFGGGCCPPAHWGASHHLQPFLGLQPQHSKTLKLNVPL